METVASILLATTVVAAAVGLYQLNPWLCLAWISYCVFYVLVS